MRALQLVHPRLPVCARAVRVRAEDDGGQGEEGHRWEGGKGKRRRLELFRDECGKKCRVFFSKRLIVLIPRSDTLESERGGFEFLA